MKQEIILLTNNLNLHLKFANLTVFHYKVTKINLNLNSLCKTLHINFGPVNL